MGLASTALASTKASNGSARPHTTASEVTFGWCLVASADNRIRSLLTAAAHAGGWETLALRTPQEAIREAVLRRVPLALIDVGGVEDRSPHADLLRTVRNSSDGLVVVCDQTTNIQGELWARQAGAWAYLPGVDETTDVASICRQARELIESKLSKTAHAHPIETG